MAEPNRLREHVFDGIQEYDNPTPGWWHAIFACSILFSIGYVAFYGMSPAALSAQEVLANRQTEELRKQFAEIGGLTPDEPTILRFMSDPKWLGVAQATFKANCSSCHGANGQGEVGLNLTDDYYKHVRILADIPRVISGGANNGAMPAWSGRLHPNEIVLLSSYVASLRGKNIPGRVPEGEKIAPWPPAPAPGGAPPASKGG